MTKKKKNVSSPYATWTRPKDWKPLPSPRKVKPIKKALKKVNSVNA